MRLARSSIQIYLAAAAHKLRAASRIDMIVRAARHGLVVIDEDCAPLPDAPFPLPGSDAVPTAHRRRRRALPSADPGTQRSLN
jgi:hypothetical protein